MAPGGSLSGWRPRLRALPVFETEPPVFDAAAASDDQFESVAATRSHTRLEYTRPGGDRWSRGMLAP